jgi:hypothetical protein
MREAVPLEAIAELAQTCRYDDLPAFLETNREYASRISVAIPPGDDRDRVAAIRRQVRDVKTAGVPRGLEMTAP